MTKTDRAINAQARNRKLAVALFRSVKADELIERMGPIAAMWCIIDMLDQGSKDVWADLYG